MMAQATMQPESTELRDRAVTLFHAPQTRSAGVLILLEELRAEYRLDVLNLKTGDQRQPAYRAINPMGKVPAIRHGEAIVTEQVAIFAYLADLYPEAGLAPALDDPLRGPYLRWLAFYGSCFEPALIDYSQKRAPAPQATSPYGDYETTIKTLVDQLTPGPCLLGERYTAADVLWGTALTWTMRFKLVPEDPTLLAYTERHNARPAVRRAQQIDAELAAKQK